MIWCTPLILAHRPVTSELQARHRALLLTTLSHRSIYIAAPLALVLTLLVASVPGRTTATYPDIMGCEQSCEVAASGLPVPFIADYPGLSPVNSADLMGAILGLDRVLWDRAALAFSSWFAVSMAGVWIAARVRARRRQ